MIRPAGGMDKKKIAGGDFMLEIQIVRYTELIKRRSELLLCSGISWRPEYAEELRSIDMELTELRKEMRM